MNIAFISPNDHGVWQLRRDLISTLIQHGHNVTVLTPDGPFVERIKILGATVHLISMKRQVAPISDIISTCQMYQFFRKNNYDIAFTISIKANIFGSIAAKLAGIPKRFGLVCGLGHCFLPVNNLKQWVTQFIAKKLYRLCSFCTQKLVFQNSDDCALMIKEKIISSEKTHVIKSSGINLDEYSTDKIPLEVGHNIRTNDFGVDNDTVVVGFVARVIVSKGIHEFIRASEIARDWNVKIKFILIGNCDPSEPDSLELEELTESDTFKWIGFRSDIKEVIQSVDILTSASFYREGVPRSILEGMALGKPIVATDNVGCRETVDEGVNGYLVPIKDAVSFAKSVKKLVMDKKLRQQFGEASRRKVEQEFDVTIVNKRIMEEVFGIEYVTIPDKVSDKILLHISTDVNNKSTNLRHVG